MTLKSNKNFSTGMGLSRPEIDDEIPVDDQQWAWLRRLRQFVDVINGVPKIRAIPTFTDATLTNSWTNFGAPFYNAGYTVDPFGWVILRGVIRNGTLNTSAFTLPVNMRPLNRIPFPSISNNAIGRVNVYTDGSVIPEIGSNSFYFLDGIRFFPNI